MVDVPALLAAIAARTPQVNVTFFSKVGNGKSSSGNTLLTAWGYTGPGFEARRQREAVTQAPLTLEHMLHGVKLRVTDQPGLLDARGAGVDEQHLRGTALSKQHQDGYHVIFVVQKITDRLDAAEQIILGAIHRFYGQAAGPHIVLLLTHADMLDSADEIARMVAASKRDVEARLGHAIAQALPVNNHFDRVAPDGQDRVRTGTRMIATIHDIVIANHALLKPPTPPQQVVHVPSGGGNRGPSNELKKVERFFRKLF